MDARTATVNKKHRTVPSLPVYAAYVINGWINTAFAFCKAANETQAKEKFLSLYKSGTLGMGEDKQYAAEWYTSGQHIVKWSD